MASARHRPGRAFPGEHFRDGARTRAHLVVVGLLASAACTAGTVDDGAPTLTLDASTDTLRADGHDTLTLTAELDAETRARLSGPVVVRFQASAGLLSSSTAIADETGRHHVHLTSDGPESLFGAPTREVTVRARVDVHADLAIETTSELMFVLPDDLPVLHLSSTSDVAIADGASTVALTVRLQNVDAPANVALTSSAGTLSENEVVLTDFVDGALQAIVTLTAPSFAASAAIDARFTPAHGESPDARASHTIQFVDENGPQFDLTGTFAELAIARVKMSAGTLTPNPQCASAPSLLKIEIVQNGDRLSMTHTPCTVTLPAVTTVAGTVTTDTPPAFLAALPVVIDETLLTSRALGAPLVPPEGLVVVGAELENPRTDALPTSADDARLRDDDNDGQPGVTVISSLGGEQHATYRNRGQLFGRILSSNRVDGSVPGELIAITETSVLGVGNSFLPLTTPLPGVFQMVRVDGTAGSIDVDSDGDGDISCSEIEDAASSLFDLVTPSTPTDCGGL
jgi:hypothetical protein